MRGESHSQKALDCAFCGLQERSTFSLFQHCFAIPDAYPVSLGHTLIIPYEHTEHWFTAAPEVQFDVLNALHKVKSELDECYKPDGYNIGMNCGTAAGQTIAHLHVHLIPRYKGDMPDPRGGVRGVLPEKQKYSPG